MSKYSECKVFIVKDGGNVKARVSLLVGDAMYVTGLKVVEGKNGLFIGMSSYKGKDGEYKDIYFPKSKEEREELTKFVLAAYEKKLEE